MDKLKIPHGEWVVVCDGAKALVFENEGDATFPNFATKEVFSHEDAKTHDLGSAAPGRAFAGAGSHARSAVEQTDWHDEAERTFLHQLAERLNAAVLRGDIKSIVMVAAPRALGVLRHAYPATLKAVIRAEVGKDYVKLPVYEIEKHLSG